MKIAIIGAGVSGLSCAHELEYYGVNPLVYEDTDFIGDREPHVTANLDIADRPIKDLLVYFNEMCHMDIKPVNVVKKLTHYFPNNKRTLKSDNFGYFFRRGKEYNSLIGQIYSKLKKTRIIFGQKPDVKTLSEENDFVVVANGRPDITKKLKCWNELVSGWIKGAIVKYDFDPTELIVWVNRKYCKSGYAYLCPYDSKKASLLLFVPYISKIDIDHYWKQFIEIEKLEYNILEEFYVEHFSGYVYPHKFKNIYFVGSAGGAISPLLGFGQTNSISMGVFSAQSIVEGMDYESLISNVIKKELSMYELRKSFNRLSNRGYDNLLKVMALPGLKHLFYNTNINIAKYGAGALKLGNKIFKKE